MLSGRVNGQIPAPRVRVIDEIGHDLGILTLGDALRLAQERGEDLVEIGPDDEPPLCQVTDYGRYRWKLQQTRNDREHD